MHTCGLLDEEVIEWWLDIPYAQKFYVEKHFQLDVVIGFECMLWIRFHKFETRFELVVKATVITGLGTRTLKKCYLKRMVFDRNYYGLGVSDSQEFIVNQMREVNVRLNRLLKQK